MNAIRLLAETAETVTISRADLDALIDAAEDAEDIASVRVWKAYVAAVGRDAAIVHSYTGAAETNCLHDGKSALRIWRKNRVMPQRPLAAAAIPAGYLSEIES